MFRAGSGPAWFVSAIGVLLFVLSIWHYLVFGLRSPVEETALGAALTLFEFVLMLGFSAGLMYAGVWLGRSPFTVEQRWWVVLWFIMGVAGVVAVVMLVQFNQILDGRGVSRQSVVEELLLAACGGGVVGFFTGLTNAELRQRRSEVAAQRDAFESLNDFLRHNVLNGMQYVLGYADVLAESVGDDDRAYLETIRTQSEDIVFVIQNARALTRAITSDGRQLPMDLSTVLAEEVDAMTDRYDHVTVSRTIQDGVHVSGEETLPVVVRSLLATLVQQAGDEAPAVTVTLEATDGTGLVTFSSPTIPQPDGDSSALGADAGRNSAYVADELGLDLVRQVVQRYGGDVWYDGSGDHGAAVKLELPLAESP